MLYCIDHEGKTVLLNWDQILTLPFAGWVTLGNSRWCDPACFWGFITAGWWVFHQSTADVKNSGPEGSWALSAFWFYVWRLWELMAEAWQAVTITLETPHTLGTLFCHWVILSSKYEALGGCKIPLRIGPLLNFNLPASGGKWVSLLTAQSLFDRLNIFIGVNEYLSLWGASAEGCSSGYSPGWG